MKTDLEFVEEAIQKYKPEVVVIDSIQTMFQTDVDSSPGQCEPGREATSTLMQIAKGMGVTVFIIGHVTKRGVWLQA